MDTNRLKQFCAIAETGSMTKAAQLLYISHSGLSKSMKILQIEINMILFRPAGRGIVLTEEGREFYQRAKIFLEHEIALYHAVKQEKTNTLRIGTVEIFLTVLTKPLTTEQPSLPIKLLDLEPGQIETMVRNNQLDYGITYVPYPMEKLEITEIGSYHLGCYHLRGRFKKTSLVKLPFVVPACGLSPNHLGIKERDGWLDCLSPRNKYYEVNLLSTALELTLNGLCAIYLPDFVVKKINEKRNFQHQLVAYTLPKNIKQKQRVFLLNHQDHGQRQSIKKMIALIRQAIWD